jgi:hypothetical protein
LLSENIADAEEQIMCRKLDYRNRKSLVRTQIKRNWCKISLFVTMIVFGMVTAYIYLIRMAWVRVLIAVCQEEENRMRKFLIILVLGVPLWLSGSAQNTAFVNAHRANMGTAGLEEVLYRFGVPLADLPGPDVSDLPEFYQQMVHRLLSVPPSERPPMQACFYPGTDPKVVERVTQLLYTSPPNPLDYYLGARWSTTANGSTGSQGNPIILTYSFVPDGVSIPGGVGEPTSSNILYATMNSLFGSEAVWKAKFAQCFARWSALIGVTYVEVSDDGAAFSPSFPGVLGLRGDVRIASHPIDGAYNILAYTYYPNNGDMVFDSDEPWNTSSGDYIFFRNIVMHEHGHGLGIAHVCPITQTKLLEPYYTSAFDGPQHDDIRAGQRNYGDRYENNDASGTATDLGSVPNGTTTISNVGTDNGADTDWFKFTVPAYKRVSALMSPVGASYFSDQQNPDGSCPTATTWLYTRDDQNLDLRLYGTDGTTILYNANTHGAGASETVPTTNLTSAGSYYLRVLNNVANDSVQLYTLSFIISDMPIPTITVTSPNGGETWYTGENHNVTWTSSNLTGNVCIAVNRSYSGGNWDTLAASVSNTGSWSWPVTGPATAAVRIRVSSVSQPTVLDISDANFTIVQTSITVTSPNGGETWYTVENDNITWTSVGPVGNVCIAVNRSYSGGSWDTLAASVSNTGSWSWAVTGPATAAARIRVSSVSQPSVLDISDANFTIAQTSIMVTSPNGGETWYTGENHSVTWTSVGPVGNVNIELDRGYPSGSWELLFASTANDGTEPWTVVGPVTSAARMRVTSVLYATVADTSDAEFVIAESLPPNAPQVVISTDSADVHLFWNPIPGSGIQYRVYADSTFSGTFSIVLGTTADTTFTDSGAVASPPLKHFYRVKTIAP